MVPNNDNDPRPGHNAEMVLVKSIMGMVLPVAERMAEERSEAVAGGHLALISSFTLYEESCFNKFNYMGYTKAVVASMLAFGGLFGGMRFVSYRIFLKAKVLPGSPEYHVKASAQRQKFAALEKTGQSKRIAKNDALREVAPQSSTGLQNADIIGYKFISSELWTQVQLLFSSSIALLVGCIAANIGMDSDQVLKDISEIPNKPGQSEFCRQICPALVVKYNEMLDMNSLEPLHDVILQEFDEQLDQQSELTMAVRQYRPKELLSFPATEQLESAVNLVENCRRRMEFEDECRRRSHRVDPTTGLVDVPEPGVPDKFIRLASEQEIL